MNLQSISERLESYLIESEDLFWQNWVGLKDEIDIEAVAAKAGGLFSLETIEFIRNKLQNTQSTDEKHVLRSILGQLTLSFMESEGSDIQGKILTREAETTVDWEGESIPIRSFGVRIMNQEDQQKRRDMIALREKTVDEVINPLKRELVEKMFLTVRSMGYKNYIDLCSETQDRDFHSFALEMRRFLEDTEDIYRKYLDAYLKKATGQGLTPETHSSDLTAVMRYSLFDQQFPTDTLVPVLEKTVGGMGFALDKIHLDLEDRPSKKPRACVSAVNPPDDVRLTIYPVGGLEDYCGLLHEAGHAIHFIHEEKDLNFIFKYWGDRGFTEGTAYLFQNITMNPFWLKNIMNIDAIQPLLKYSAFMGILRFRRLIGQFLYLVDLFASEDPDKSRDQFSYYYQKAHQVQFDSGNYLNFDMEFYSAGYIRARMFELQLREYLVNQFGNEWYASKDTGEYLVSLFRHGRKNRADDVALELGYKGLDPDYYRKRYCEMLI